mmetsp:Transcript_8308/g.26547  ORF Transcript_8308/g.26547 Transcript_8308/m.26547 type:complete len:368 (+) Transcript_8308:225-1328(+)
MDSAFSAPKASVRTARPLASRSACSGASPITDRGAYRSSTFKASSTRRRKVADTSCRLCAVSRPLDELRRTKRPHGETRASASALSRASAASLRFSAAMRTTNVTLAVRELVMRAWWSSMAARGVASCRVTKYTSDCERENCGSAVVGAGAPAASLCSTSSLLYPPTSSMADATTSSMAPGGNSASISNDKSSTLRCGSTRTGSCCSRSPSSASKDSREGNSNVPICPSTFVASSPAAASRASSADAVAARRLNRSDRSAAALAALAARAARFRCVRAAAASDAATAFASIAAATKGSSAKRRVRSTCASRTASATVTAGFRRIAAVRTRIVPRIASVAVFWDEAVANERNMTKTEYQKSKRKVKVE